ncbi:ATP-binding protein [Streptomyces paludis]|uniref:ATP-binding protein n=1 Tax=Streptomyces paludis TaxID=2282738 RepID=A0A345HUE1_9ACTN|nr:ATP-binding protein [Streptomyces paludis]AXG80315.1 ATP-binding protein [Streptomyces paludis]
MDPIHRGPDEYERDDVRGTAADDAGRPGPSDSSDRADHPVSGGEHGSAVAHIKGGGVTPPPVRTVQLISGDLLLTVNPVDGSEIERCPPGSRPDAPERRTAEERADLQRAGRPPVPPGPAAQPLPLLERREERERLAELLGRGRSVRLTGQAGSGRTALLEAVATDCADLAPDGVVRLSGHRRTTTELLYELYAAVHKAPRYRPDRTELHEAVRGIGAVVVLDDLELGGEALDELLAATPECAYLLAATPETEQPSAGARLDEVPLGGLGRGSSLELLERIVDRALTDEEANWAGDLWFESEGLPLRFVQAGSLLRQRDLLRGGADLSDEFEPFARVSGDALPVVAGAGDAADGYDTPLPTLGEGAAPAALLASRLSDAARATLRFAVALGGEVPHQAHLPALVGDTHADAALGELMSCGLLTPVGPRYRLAPGVAAQLTARGYADDAAGHAHTAAQHYAWWAGHPSVTPERAVAEADAILAAMGPLVAGEPMASPGTSDREAGHPSAAVLLARSAAPAFLAGLHWGALERVLRTGSEAARLAGEVAEEAYFHHELGVLALCVGNLPLARAELEASIALRGAVADKVGTVAGRRALALVTDREGGPRGLSSSLVRHEAPARSAAPVPLALPPSPADATPTEVHAPMRALPAGPGGYTGPGALGGGPGGSGGPGGPGSGENATLVSRQGAAPSGRRPAFGGARRNLVAAGAGAVLAAVLGTVVTIGATSGNEKAPVDKLRTEQSADPDSSDDPGTDDQPVGSTNDDPGTPLIEPNTPDAPTRTTSDGPSESATPTDSPSDDGTDPSDDGTDPSQPPEPTPTPTPTHSSTSPPTPTSEPPASPPTSEEPTTNPTDTDTEPPPTTPENTLSAPMTSEPTPDDVV